MGCHMIFDVDQAIDTAMSSYVSENTGRDSESLESGLRSSESSPENPKRLNSPDQPAPRDQTNSNRSTNQLRRSDLLDDRSKSAIGSGLESRGDDVSKPAASYWQRIEQEVQNDREKILNRLDPQSSSIHQTNGPVQLGGDSADRIEVNSQVIQIVDSPTSKEYKSLDTSAALIQPPIMSFTPLVPLTGTDAFQGLSGRDQRQSEITWRDSLEATVSHLEEELNSQQIGLAEAERLKNFLVVLQSLDEEGSLVDWVTRFQDFKSSLPKHHFEAFTGVLSAGDGQPIDSCQLISRLKEAINEVSHSADLKIKNVAICTEVEGFGKVKKFSNLQFRPGDEILVYCEIENFTEEKSVEVSQVSSGKSDAPQTHVCRFDAQVQFLNADGETDHVTSFADIRDNCQTSRTDFYMFFRIQIPNLPPGSHLIQVRLNDKVGHKNAALPHPVAIVVKKPETFQAKQQ